MERSLNKATKKTWMVHGTQDVTYSSQYSSCGPTNAFYCLRKTALLLSSNLVIKVCIF